MINQQRGMDFGNLHFGFSICSEVTCRCLCPFLAVDLSLTCLFCFLLWETSIGGSAAQVAVVGCTSEEWDPSVLF